jgi:2-polyprenyl-3-methyl-5-hydroxy-6-metoxy-1,4-benzoquinol methylase
MRIDKNALQTFAAVIREVDHFSSDCNLCIADIGCDDGQLLSLLSERGYGNLTGIGYHVTVPLRANKFEQVDLSSENWSSRLSGLTFDCVISTDVIEHQTNPYAFLVEIRKIIKTDGKLILTFPNVHNLRSILGYAISGRFSGFFGPNFNDGHPLYDQHIFVPNMHLLHYFLKLTGFTVQRLEYVFGMGRLFAQTTVLVAIAQES